MLNYFTTLKSVKTAIKTLYWLNSDRYSAIRTLFSLSGKHFLDR